MSRSLKEILAAVKASQEGQTTTGRASAPSSGPPAFAPSSAGSDRTNGARNVETGARVVEDATISEDLRAWEQLPRAVRQGLADAHYEISSIELLGFARGGGWNSERRVLDVLRHSVIVVREHLMEPDGRGHVQTLVANRDWRDIRSGRPGNAQGRSMATSIRLKRRMRRRVRGVRPAPIAA